MGLTMYLGYELYERSEGFDWGKGVSKEGSAEKSGSEPELSLPDQTVPTGLLGPGWMMNFLVIPSRGPVPVRMAGLKV